MLKIKFFQANENEGFNFPFILIYPKKFNKINKIFIESFNSVDYEEKGQDDFVAQIESAIIYAKKLTEYQNGKIFNMAYLYQCLNQPVIIPIIERCDKKYEQEFYTQMLGRNVMLEQNGKFANLPKQIINMAQHSKKILEKKGIIIDEKYGALGISASGVFASRLVFAEPEHFDVCLSVCSNAVQPLPISTLNNTDLLYPVGTYDYEKIFGKPFDKNQYYKIKQLFIVGKEEDNCKYDISQNPRLHSPEIQNIYKNLYGDVSLQDRQNLISEIFKNLNCENISCIVADGGHSLSGKGNLVSKWAKENILSNKNVSKHTNQVF